MLEIKAEMAKRLKVLYPRVQVVSAMAGLAAVDQHNPAMMVMIYFVSHDLKKSGLQASCPGKLLNRQQRITDHG